MGTRVAGLDWRFRLLPAVLWAVYVFFASLTDPGGGSVSMTGPLGFIGFDKWLHVGTYATFAFLTAVGLWARTNRQLAVVCLVTVTFGISMEALQYPLAARSADLFDAAANTVGTAVGLGVWTATWRIVSGVVETATADSVG